MDRGTLTLTKGLENEKPTTKTEKEKPGKLEGNQESVVPEKQREEKVQEGGSGSGDTFEAGKEVVVR